MKRQSGVGGRIPEPQSLQNLFLAGSIDTDLLLPWFKINRKELLAILYKQAHNLSYGQQCKTQFSNILTRVRYGFASSSTLSCSRRSHLKAWRFKLTLIYGYARFFLEKQKTKHRHTNKLRHKMFLVQMHVYLGLCTHFFI